MDQYRSTTKYTLCVHSAEIVNWKSEFRIMARDTNEKKKYKAVDSPEMYICTFRA